MTEELKKLIVIENIEKHKKDIKIYNIYITLNYMYIYNNDIINN